MGSEDVTRYSRQLKGLCYENNHISFNCTWNKQQYVLETVPQTPSQLSTFSRSSFLGPSQKWIIREGYNVWPSFKWTPLPALSNNNTFCISLLALFHPSRRNFAGWYIQCTHSCFIAPNQCFMYNKHSLFTTDTLILNIFSSEF